VTPVELAEGTLTRLPCGHVLCEVCRSEECLACLEEQPAEDVSPVEGAVEEGELMLWAYGELLGIPEAERYAREQLALVLTGLRLWAEAQGINTSDLWRETWQRSVALKSIRKG